MPIGPKDEMDRSEHRKDCQGGGANMIVEMQTVVDKFIDVYNTFRYKASKIEIFFDQDDVPL